MNYFKNFRFRLYRVMFVEIINQPLSLFTISAVYNTMVHKIYFTKKDKNWYVAIYSLYTISGITTLKEYA